MRKKIKKFYNPLVYNIFLGSLLLGNNCMFCVLFKLKYLLKNILIVKVIILIILLKVLNKKL